MLRLGGFGHNHEAAGSVPKYASCADLTTYYRLGLVARVQCERARARCSGRLRYGQQRLTHSSQSQSGYNEEAGKVSSGTRRAPIMEYLVSGLLLEYNTRELDARAGCDSYIKGMTCCHENRTAFQCSSAFHQFSSNKTTRRLICCFTNDSLLGFTNFIVSRAVLS
jgi:hypothetical protein